MAHEITEHDGLVLHKKRAWHGLGTIVEEAPTPEEALHLAGLDWMPLESDALHGTFWQPGGISSTVCQSHKMIVRSDKPEIILGIVGKNYTPVPNHELASLCYDVCESWQKENPNSRLKVETAGSLFAGRKVWFLLKADPFAVIGHKGDIVERYTLAFNGFDGSTALSFMPTTVRVVCNNTLTGALDGRAAGGADAGIKIKHSAGVRENLNFEIQALKEAEHHLHEMEEAANVLARKTLNLRQRDAFWKAVYCAIYKKKDPFTETEGKARQFNKAVTTVGAWNRLLENEIETNQWERTAWTAVNAVTNWIDHERPIRRTKSVTDGDQSLQDIRLAGNLWGAPAAQKTTAVRTALSMC